ncbi:MAG: hypothetical protein ACOZAO_04580 [Patescibacteria group bacterium]
MPENHIEEQVNKLVSKESNPLMIASTVFPFTLFPDRIEVYRKKIVIVRNYLPLLKTEFPILIKDIKTVTVTTGVFFATIVFEIEGYEHNPEPISYLKRGESLELRKLLTGLTIISKQEIPNEDIPREQLVEQSKQLG